MSPFARIALGCVLVAPAACAVNPAPADQDMLFRHEEDRESGTWQFTSYLKDVGLDFMDIFTLDVGVGKAGPLLFFGDAYVTKYAELGAGNFTGYKAGMLGRGIGSWREERYDGGFSFLGIQNYSVDAVRIPYCGTDPLKDKYLVAHGYNIDLDENRHWSDVGASLYLIGIGADASLSPYEFVDFFFGLFGNYPNPARIGGNEMPWDIGSDSADDDTRLSIYDDKLGRYRNSDYSIWPTIWPTTFEHEEIEGGEWEQRPPHDTSTGSFGGAYGGDRN